MERKNTLIFVSELLLIATDQITNTMSDSTSLPEEVGLKGPTQTEI